MTRTIRVVAALFAATLFAHDVAAQDAGVCTDWRLVSTPAGPGTTLASVDAIDAKIAWAVGQQAPGASSTAAAVPLAMSWDGSAWTAEPLPDLTHLGLPAAAAVAIAPTGDPWVVGHLRDARTRRTTPLVLRFTGGTWEAHEVVLLNSFAARYPLLRDVAVAGETDAWTVGEASGESETAIGPFAAHWDGRVWSEVEVPAASAGNRILTAVAIAPGSVWAVGYDVDPSFRSGSYARILRFDVRGRSWSVVDQPASSIAGTVLYDVVALAANDVWAVGANAGEPLFLHWDGIAWTSHAGPAGDIALSVDGAAANDVWAAGSTGNYHWDGTRWTFQQVDVPSGARRAVAVAGPCDAWAITSWSDAAAGGARIERLGASRTTEAEPILPGPLPETPVALVVEPRSPREIAVSWRPAVETTSTAGQLAFAVERCTGEAGACETDFEVVHKTGLVTSFVDSGVRSGTAYTYRVYAYNENGPSDPTAPVSARTPMPAPTTGPGTSTIPAPTGPGTSTIPAPTGPGTSTIPAPAPAGPRTSIPAPADSDVDLRVPPPPAPPATPNGFTVRPMTSTLIALGWLPVGAPASLSGPTVVIERCVGVDCADFAVIAKVGPLVTSFRDGNLRPGTSYTYRIYAVSPSGESAPTAPVTARTPAPAPTPNNTHAEDAAADAFDVPYPAPAPAPRSSFPASSPSPNDDAVCTAVTADILIHPDLSLGSSSVTLEIVLRDARGERVEAQCLPVQWAIVLDDTTPQTAGGARLSVDASTRFATVVGRAGTYTIRATARGGLVSAAVVTLS